MITQVVIFLLILTSIGIIFLKSKLNETRFYVLLPAGMIWGLATYILLLNFVSKILPGKNGVILSTLILMSLGIWTFLKYRKKFIFNFKQINLISSLIIISLILGIGYFSRLKMTSILPVADADMQWAYAASFARGNHPLMTPWQPDLTPNYHLGAYFLEGALLSLFRLPLITINAILNTFFLFSGSLFAIFLFWENKYAVKNLWNVIAALVLYISYGVVIFILPGQDFLGSNTIYHLTKYPEDIISKGIAGASLVDLNSLSYLPARSLGMGLTFLALYFTFAKFKNLKTKIIFFIVLFSVISLVEESMFLPVFGVAVELLILGFIPLSYFNPLKKYSATLFKILAISLIVIILQGGFFSEFLNYNKSSFNINLPLLNSSFFSQFKMLGNYIIPDSNLVWILFSPILFILLIFIYSIRSKNHLLTLIALYSITAFACFLIIEYKYYPSNNIRFFNLGYISAGTGFIYLLFNILKSQSIARNLFYLTLITPLILIPTLLPELLNQYHQINEARLKSTRSQILITSNSNTPFEQVSDWASKNLPPNSKIISVDTTLPKPLRSLQFEFKGIYTILGPQNLRVMRQEPGVEYYDLILTLNPSLLIQTKTEYVYIESESLAYQQLPEFRKDQLNSTKYFQPLKSIDAKDNAGQSIYYRLYKINPLYLEPNDVKEVEEGSLETLQNLIPNNKSVYIANYGDNSLLSFWYRMAIILALKDKDIRRNLSQTDYMIIETYLPYKYGDFLEKYDFYILAHGQIPSYSSSMIWSNIYATAWKRN